MKPVRLVASTTMSERDFWQRSLLGKSLNAFPSGLRPRLCICFENTGKWGLPYIYNQAIETCRNGEQLLFVHDDVFLHDHFLEHRIGEALARYDVVGLAGSRGSDLSQPSWVLKFDENLKPTGWQTEKGTGSKDQGSSSGSGSKPRAQSPEPLAAIEATTSTRANPPPTGIVLSGAVSHASRYIEPGVSNFAPPVALSLYGTVPAECDLLDGLFLAMNASLVQEWKVRFDERFSYHFYDLDFCRTAKKKGLRLGTWPILVSHGSGGNFDTDEFRAAARQYLDKWREEEGSGVGGRGSGPEPDPDLLDCKRCGAVLLPHTVDWHAAWHARQDSEAFAELSASGGPPTPDPRPPTESARSA